MTRTVDVSFYSRDGMPFYYCSGKALGCRKSGCYLRGGECHSTSNILYAISKNECIAEGGDTDEAQD